MIDLSVIIVSFNTRELLAKCLKSVQKDLAGSLTKGEIIVIDNNSQDGSPEIIKSAKVILIENKKNIGFGTANNQAAKIAKGRYLLFLNSDTELKNGVFKKMINFLDGNQGIGIASCQLINKDGTVQPQGGYLPRLSTVAIWAWFLDDLPVLHQILPSYQLRRKIKQTREMGWVGGMAMFVKRECWRKLGGFDENIFMYGEDVDLCYRAKKLKWKIAVNPGAVITHLGGRSGGKWIAGEVKGLIYFFKKHKPEWELGLVKLILKVGITARWLIFGILCSNENRAQAYKEALELVR